MPRGKSDWISLSTSQRQFRSIRISADVPERLVPSQFKMATNNNTAEERWGSRP